MIRRNSIYDGLRTELQFEKEAERRGFEVKKSSRSDDMKKHIDYYVRFTGASTYWGFDVKKSKSPDEMWIEHTNVRGDDGWLRGDSNFIAFHLQEGDERFLIVSRKELLDLWDSKVNMDTTTDKSQSYFRAYQRKNRKDLIAKVTESDLKGLVTSNTWVVSK